MTQNIKRMVMFYERQITDVIETGDFPVRVIIRFLNEYADEKNRFIRGSVNRIIEAVKTANYTVRFDGQSYYIYR